MQKIKLFFYILLTLLNLMPICLAQEKYGNVILDLKDDAEYNYDDRQFWPMVMQKGYLYINDVKQYNDQLDGDNIDRDFTDDIKSKYPDYSNEGATLWQNYVRKGVKLVRIWDSIKQRVKQWVLDYELPIVVDDDQYEMNEDEEYIESDTPIVRTNFKKVIAYSNSPKDQLAIQEKRALDNNLPRPSKTIQWYRENILQGNWKKIWNNIWNDNEGDPYENEKKADKAPSNTRLKTSYSILMKYNGIGDNGKFEGVINIIPPTGKIILLKDYKDYTGLQLDFSRSENIKDISVHFMLPQDIKIKDEHHVLFYGSEFPVYFGGTAEDITKDVVLRLHGTANVCTGNDCEIANNFIETIIKHIDNPITTRYDYYVDLTKINSPNAVNKKEFKIIGLFSEKRAANLNGIKLEFSCSDNAFAKVFMIGKNSDYFSAPQISLHDGKIEAWFKLLNNEFNFEDKEFTFWLTTKFGKQYLTTLPVTTPFILDSDNYLFSLNILCLAILGGFLLNFMPCVFPVLSLKLLAFTKFGGLNKSTIRSNFLYNSLGIFTAFAIMALLLSCLKMLGISLGWGMQFQSLTFLFVIIWVVTYFLAYVFGIVDFSEQKLVQKITKSSNKSGRTFEFLSGIFMVVLSTPCMAPYLGTALGIALAGSPYEIILTVMATGIGLALPYILIALFPQIAFYMPRPGKWLNIINTLMIAMLVITLLWLVNLLAIQIGTNQIWHWLLYITIILIAWTYFHFVKIEIDKIADHNIKSLLNRRYNLWRLAITLIIIAISFADVRWNIYKQKTTIQTPIWPINMDTINNYTDKGFKVFVKIGANWCLTCKYNETFVLNQDYIQENIKNNNVIVMDVDWTNYNEQVLHFMRKFGRQGLPFYVLFSPKFRDGIVLPEILDKHEFNALINM